LVAAANPFPKLYNQLTLDNFPGEDSRLDIKLDPVDPIGDCPRRDLTDVGENQQDYGDSRKNACSGNTVFSSHFIG
jgi:hypothetical protein